MTGKSTRVAEYRASPLDLSQGAMETDFQVATSASGSAQAMASGSATTPRARSRQSASTSPRVLSGPITSIKDWLQLNLIEEGRSLMEDLCTAGDVGEITVGDKEGAPGMAPGVVSEMDITQFPVIDQVDPQFQRARQYNSVIRTSITHERFLNHCLKQDVLPLYAYGLCPIPGFYPYASPENKRLTDFRVEQGRELLRFLKGLFTDQRRRIARQLRADVSTMVRLYGQDAQGASYQCGKLDYIGNEVQRKEEEERCQRFSKLPTREDAERMMQSKVLGLPRNSVPGASREIEVMENPSSYDDPGYSRRGRGGRGANRGGYSWRRESVQGAGYRGRGSRNFQGRGGGRGGSTYGMVLTQEELAEVRRSMAAKSGGT